mmetsp:Transcript_2954/g.9041  ORF Transcript_2954/g.9041 Transcript_2954/m.9041 type:complete len:152 (-) Transcript_2954:1940-2395(-)
MIICIVIASFKTGGVLFSRFYGPDYQSEVGQATLLQSLRDATADEWPNLVADNAEQCAYLNNIHIMYKLIGDVVLTLAGNDETDHLILLEFARAFEAVLMSALRIKQNQEISVGHRILQSYSKLAMVVEEMILDGVIDQMDTNMIMSLIQM